MQLRWDLRPCGQNDVQKLVERHHGYGSMGTWAAYRFAVYEGGEPVAAFAWQPPPMGAARSVCPENPQGVLALSRMVAVPKAERKLQHISKPLKYQMLHLIDRTRWPVLVTFSDESQGHNGFVYQCSGWVKTRSMVAPVYENDAGQRVSRLRGGMIDLSELTRRNDTTLQRWEHWACPKGQAMDHFVAGGWRHEPVPGKIWKSGNQAYRIVRRA